MSRFLAFLLLLIPAFVSAQQDAAAVRDRFATLADSTELRQIEQRHARARTSADDFAAGFAALRLWEVTGTHRHAQRAREYFDRIIARDPDAAWAHYGHALTLQADMERPHSFIVTHISAQRALGYDAVSRARRALERAVALDPELPGARELLIRYAAESRDRDALLQVRASFERTLEEGDGDADVYLGLAAATRELRDIPAAVDAARHAVRRAPESADAHFELAASLALMRDSALQAGTAYLTALRLADDQLLRRMWQDVLLIAQPAEQTAWSAAISAEAKREVLRTFWNMRGALAALTAAERAAEHYARLHVAHHEFRRQGMFGAPPYNVLRWEHIDDRYDDRGVIYIRHGAPQHVVGGGIANRITWFYSDDAGQPLSFHFQRFDAAGWQWDYVLVRNLYCDMNAEVLRYDRRLMPLGRMRCDYSLSSISKMVRDDAEHALVTDTHRPSFATAIPFHYDWYSFRGAGGTSTIVMAVGVPLASIARAGDWRLALTIADTARGAVMRSSVQGGSLPAGTAADGVLGALLIVDAAAARAAAYRVDLRSETDRTVGMLYGGSLRITSYAGDTLMMSDVVLAEPRDGGSFVRAGHALALSPTQVFGRGEFRVFYEIYNLPPGTTYRTEIVVEALEAGLKSAVKRLFGRDEAVKLEFQDVAADNAGSTIAELRDVTAPFPPGMYQLRVTLTVPGAKSLTRTRRFRIE